jgi:NADPH:quinone reductase-like Zn-dependent oxidoreductase
VRAQFPQRSKVERQQSSPATRRLNLVIDGTFRLASCADCHRYLESGNQFGKVVLKV